jgi:hypothetical protein
VYIAEIGAEEATLLANPLYRPRKPDAEKALVSNTQMHTQVRGHKLKGFMQCNAYKQLAK